LVIWAGLGLALVGWADVIMGMYPYRVGNPDWEFGAISTALDSMPLGAIGLTALTSAALAGGRRVVLRILFVVSALVVAFLIYGLLLYGLSVPVVLNAVPTAVRSQLTIAIVKTAILGFVYITLYALIFRAAWRGTSLKK
jgi:hypothetical protein